MKHTPTILIVIPFGFNERLTNFFEFTLGRLLVRSGWRVIGIAQQERGESSNSIVHGIEVHKYQGLLRGCMLLLHLFMRHPDLVHIHMLRNNRIAFAVTIFSKLVRVPVVFTEPGLLHDHYLVEDRDDPLGKPVLYENFVSTLGALLLRSMRAPWSFFYFLRSYVFHFSLSHADHVVFYSKHNLPIAEKLGLKHLQYIQVIQDDVRWEPVDAAYVHAPIMMPPAPFALFVGQLKERKGWDIFLTAIPHIPRNTIDHFVIVSSSADREPEDIGGIVEKLGIRDRFTFVGRPSNEELKKLFEGCSIVIVPSRYEGFGIVPLEAFEVGKPVVASRVDAMTDYLTHGQNSYLVAPKDPQALAEGVIAVSNDADLQRRLVEGGKKTLTTLRSSENADAWLTFYRSVIKK